MENLQEMQQSQEEQKLQLEQQQKLQQQQQKQRLPLLHQRPVSTESRKSAGSGGRKSANLQQFSINDCNFFLFLRNQIIQKI
jgi:hypothetical protein